MNGSQSCAATRKAPGASGSELRAYNRLKLGIAAQLRPLMELLKKRGSDSRFRRCEELMSKLADDRFTLAVLGQFKRGKSSLMNAIIGRELLPVGVQPLTSAITVLRFGPAERLIVRREGRQFIEVMPVSALSDFVTENGNPSNWKRVKTATVEAPLPFLRHGLEFVDTPGVGSAIEANTAATRAFLPDCDAAIFVTSTEAPLKAAELDFLRTVREHAQKIFYVLNKTDLCASEKERREAVDFMARTIREQIVSEEVRVFPVSARMALTAKTHPGEDATRSGLAALEEALSVFLAREKAALLLKVVIDRALRITKEEAGEVELFKKARTLPPEARQQRLEAIRRRYGELAEERNHLLMRLRADLDQQAQETLSPALEAFLEQRKALAIRHLRRMIARAGWRSGGNLASRVGERISKRIRAQTEARLRDQLGHLKRYGDKAVSAEWSKIAENLGELSRCAFASFGLPIPAGEEFVPAWHIASGSNASMARAFGWRPRNALLLLPVPLARTALATVLQAETERLLGAVRRNALTIIEATVAAAVEMYGAEVGARAAEIEARIAASINGTRLPRRAPSQGMEPPEMAGWGEGMLETIRDRLTLLKEQVQHIDVAGQEMEPAPPLVEFEAPSGARPAKLRETEMSMERRLATRGCPVCDHLADIAFNFLAKKQYTLYLDECEQAKFAATHGLCPLHLWQLHAVSSPLGASAGLARLAEETSRALTAAMAGSDIRILTPDASGCGACAQLGDEEQRFCKRLALYLREPGSRIAYSRSQGVCLRHLALLMAAVSNDGIAGFLLAEAARHFGQTAEDMQSYAMKCGGMRSPAINADENDAAWRAVVHLAGSRNVCAPWPPGGEI